MINIIRKFLIINKPKKQDLRGFSQSQKEEYFDNLTKLSFENEEKWFEVMRKLDDKIISEYTDYEIKKTQQLKTIKSMLDVVEKLLKSEKNN